MVKLKPFKIFDIDSPDDVCEVPEGCCLLGYRGSKAHAMYIPGTDPNSIDDVDLMGIILCDQGHYLGLNEWGSRGTLEVKNGKWDSVYYEIRKLFGLLLQGNPNVMSLLWNSPKHYLYLSELGRRILDNRNIFVGRHVYNAFAGYAHAQLEKMETRDPYELRMYLAVTAEAKRRGIHPNQTPEESRPFREAYDKGMPIPHHASTELTGELKDAGNWHSDRVLAALKSFMKKGENLGYLGDKRKHQVLEHGYDSKNAAHCIRLLRMCKEFMATGEMLVERPDAAELLDIKRGKWPLVQVKEHAKALFEEVRAAKDASTLPEEPNRVAAESLLCNILSDHLRLKVASANATELVIRA